MSEKDILNQPISENDLKEAAGGWHGDCGSVRMMADDAEEAIENAKDCAQALTRDIYDGGFANCMATVEDNSWCGKNDACVAVAIRYRGMKECDKAWK